MTEITTEEHRNAARDAQQVLAIYEENYDKISVGVYEQGSDEKVDNAINRIGEVESFLRQGRHEHVSLPESVAQLQAMFPQ
jgi:flagellum-specific ATP synthase